MLALALGGAQHRPRVVMFTALPLVWGEGDAADILAGRARSSELLAIIGQTFEVRPIDTVSTATLGKGIVMIAQPRRMTPGELVTLDAWVRRGGRAMIFADPELIWPSRYPLGDTRRAPPVTLLDPLFAYWGVTLGDSDRRIATQSIDGKVLVTHAAGQWRGPTRCAGSGGVVLDCRIGKGRVLFVGDADLLDPRLWKAIDGQNGAWVAARLESLNGQAAPAVKTRWVVIAGISAAIILAILTKFRRT